MTNNRFSGSVILGQIICFYWFLYWLMNGADKFLHGRDLLLFRWSGKDRISQFGDYFNRVNIPEDWINPVLYTLGFWEIALSLCFLIASLSRCGTLGEQKRWGIAMLGLSMGAFTFIAFSVFDIISGDRAELLEHGIYLGLIILSWLVVLYLNDRSAGGFIPDERSQVR